MNPQMMEQYTAILREELVPALGCTEPIAIALASAKARDVLGGLPERLLVRCSGNLVKNVKCVVVPNTKNLIGIEASAVVGAVGGEVSKDMEVLSGVTEEQVALSRRLLAEKICRVELLETPLNLHLQVRAERGEDWAEVEIKNLHNHITRVEKNGKALYVAEESGDKYCGVLTDRGCLSVDGIIEYANECAPDLLRELFSPQINCNLAIAEEGLSGKYGVGIGLSIVTHDRSLSGRIKGYASAASEARMSGCVLPVITNSGSGNQGIAASVPVVVFARETGFPEERMLRALALSNLLTIYQKTFIGRLSAFCGAVSASVSSGAAVTYLTGGTPEQIKMTLVNALANVSGIVCDGAKASCGAKIAASLEAAMTGHYLAMDNRFYQPHTGILQSDVDGTITAVGRMATEGMKDTDRVILNIMLGK